MACRARRVSHLEQADLAEVDVREGVTDEWVEARPSILTSKTAPPPAGTSTVCTPFWNVVISWFTQARSKIVPTMWKFVSRVGPAATTQKRTVSPGSAVSGCVTYWFA